jgi:hypothetical protein
MIIANDQGMFGTYKTATHNQTLIENHCYGSMLMNSEKARSKRRANARKQRHPSMIPNSNNRTQKQQ